MSRVSDHILRTLWYIELVASQGQQLSLADIDSYAQAPQPRDAQREQLFLGGTSLFSGLYGQGKVKRRPEAVAHYLVQVGWIKKGDDGVTLTKIGRAVLRAESDERSAGEDLDPEVADIALDPEDPMVYVQLTRRLQKAGQGLLVDAYFHAYSLEWLVESTTLRRILTSSRHPSSGKDRQLLAVALATIPNGADVELRHTADPSLHDRCVVSEDGSVQLLGSSVNGVGRHLTAVIAPSADIAEVYRKKYEDLWASAERVHPQPMEAPSGR
ncbi:hypothetical protein ABZX65_07900 [Streptomyces sp. NPDC003300]|uniref:hypothetical protein n=1 Tax=unclassified Streptomyces TaxID=2593676 RepID=UPI0033BB52C1